MMRPLLLVGILASGLTAFAPALADPSNPAASPVSPSLSPSNQPTRTRVPSSVQPSEPTEPTERTPTPAEPSEPANTDAADRARSEAERPKMARTVRVGERTVAAGTLASR